MGYLIKLHLVVVLLALICAASAKDSFAIIREPYILDLDSRRCLECHIAVEPVEFCPMKGCDHPVGFDYVERHLKNPALVPRHLLNPLIRLADNVRIGCLSCHIPYSAESHESLFAQRSADQTLPDPYLIMDNRESELCLSCHKK